MLKNSQFYNLEYIAETPELIEANLNWLASHEIFKGHFPEQPIVPGVCQMQITKELLEHLVQENLMMNACRQAKFLNLITPSDAVKVQIKINKLDDQYVVNSTFLSEEKVYSKIDCIFNVIK